jgi:nitrogen fixation protein NifU and related proteins
MDIYREIILDHYQNPHHHGELSNADATYYDVNTACGDEIRMDVKVGPDGRIADVGFSGHGCAISQASASLLTDEIKGRPVADVAGFAATDLLELLGIEISPARLKCAMLSFDSLQHLLDEVGAKPLVKDPG